MTYEEKNKSEIFPIVDVQMIRRTVPAEQVMWSKEQLINLAIRNLPKDEKYVAWIDSDVAFADDSLLGLKSNPYVVQASTCFWTALGHL